MDAVMDLFHSLTEHLDAAVTSPWFYLALFAVAVIDGFFPVVPSESMVITGGVYAASTGEPNAAAVMALAALGAFIGDHVSFYVGRGPGQKMVARMKPGTRKHKAFTWAQALMRERGGLILVVARYVPGGRTAVTMTMGTCGYPRRWFAFFAGIAAISWAVYGVVLGYVGGKAFEESPIKGVAVGLGLALSVTAVVEIVRYLRKRKSAPATDENEAEVGAEPEEKPVTTG
ncbi:DedA family protein [Spirillospora sp. CA-294931]|uniref:DedA family protein n=1 Tax=Spirillospora sp. CA-294931 TaxID=3240042 RepID=UPI003D8AFF62